MANCCIGVMPPKAMFASNKDVFLVTDKIRDFNKLLEQIHIQRDRLLVEVFSYKDYRKALQLGIEYPMLCIGNEKHFYKHETLLSTGKVAIITLPMDLVPKIEHKLSALRINGLSIFAFSSNDKKTIDEKMNTYITGVYTDYIGPKDYEE